ncbi:hypothetical protein H8958_001895, partial [Nasalis larvatus]
MCEQLVCIFTEAYLKINLRKALGHHNPSTLARAQPLRLGVLPPPTGMPSPESPRYQTAQGQLRQPYFWESSPTLPCPSSTSLNNSLHTSLYFYLNRSVCLQFTSRMTAVWTEQKGMLREDSCSN